MERGIRVLHVDDQPDVAKLVARYLEREDDRIEVQIETSVAAALECLSEDPVDCIVSDYDMPGRNGIDFLEEVRETYEDLPFILHTGKGSEEVASDAIGAGVTDYLQKGAGTERYELLANRVINSVKRHRQKRDLTRYGTIVTAAGDGVYTLNPEGQFTTVNDYVIEQTGYAREELLGSHVSLLLPDSGIERGRQIVEELLENPDKRVGSHETTVTTAAGETFPIEVRIALLRGEDGAFNGTVGIARDISERRAREAELERYETIVETVADGVYALDAEGYYTYVNSYIEERTGFSREDILGSHASTYLASDDVDRIEAAMAEILAGDRDVSSLELDVPTDNGKVLPSEVRITPLPYDDRYQGLVGVLRDISGRLERERTLERQNARLREFERLVETVPAGVFQLDETGVMTHINEEWAEMTGKSTAELEGEPFETLVAQDIIPDTVIDEYVELLRELLSSSTDTDRGSIRTTATPPDATDDHVYQAQIALLPYDEEFRGTAVVVRDITEQLRYSRELQRQNERLDQFASLVSHDLRNPLSVASGRLALARETGEDEHFDAIARAHERMETLIDDLLTLAREGRAVEEIVEVDLEQVVTESWNAVQSDSSTLACDVDLQIRANRSRLQQLLENLLRNAVEHGNDSVTVRIDGLAERPGFYVADDGPGIPPDARERVFERGYSTNPEGTGFGLAIVKNIAESHGWTVEASESEAGGARIEVSGIELV